MKTTSKGIKRLLAMLIAIALTLSYGTVAMATTAEGTDLEEMTEFAEEQEQERSETLEEVWEDTAPEETVEFKEEPEPSEEVMEISSTVSDAKDSDVAVYDAIRNWQTTTRNVEPPSTYDEVYNRIVDCMEIIPQNTVWTDFMPYGIYTSLSPHDKEDPNIGYLGEAYTWNGGVFKVDPSDPGSRSGTGCAAFAFMMSDAAFGGMPARVVQRGNIHLENVHPGDILRDVNNTHFVIVLQTTEAGAIIAEANVKIDISDTSRIGKVNWSRTISKDEVENSSFMITRYVEDQDYDGDTQETLVKEGDIGTVHWTLSSKGVLTFSGSGPILDFATWEEDENGIYLQEEFARPWEDGVTTQVSSIKIGSGITSIGAYAFYQSTAMSVTIPDSVTSIGIRSFYGSSLIGVSIPKGTIGYEAFRKCKDIKTLELGEGVTSIGNYAFGGCTGIATDLVTPFTIPASVETIGSGAFMSCNSIYRLEFAPDSKLTAIGGGAFAQCWGLLAIELPYGLTKLNENLFQNSLSLWKLYIPGSITAIDREALMDTRAMQEIYYGGTEEQWIAANGPDALKYTTASNIKVSYNICSIFNPTYGGATHVYDDDTDAICNNCGHVRTAGSTLPDPPPSDTHTHNWSTDWSHDSSYHWHDCIGPNCDVSENTLKSGYGSHMFGDWITDAEATTSTEGMKHRICTVCQYSETSIIPIVPDNPNLPDTPPSDTHTHNWSTDWSHDSSYHWHDCISPNCDVSENTLKSGYGSHMFGDWITDTEATTSTEGMKHRTCTVCEYSETSTIPIVPDTNVPDNPNPPSNPSKPSTSSNPNTVDTTVSIKTNSDGSVTTTKRNNKTGTVTETTRFKDGTTTIVETPATGRVIAEVNLSQTTVANSSGTVKLPIPNLPVTSNDADAPVVKVRWPANIQDMNVAIPLNEYNAGVVAVIIKADGSEKIVCKSTMIGNDLIVPLSGNVTIKLIDNSMQFADVDYNHWAADAIAFATSRGLFEGIGDSKFAPDTNMSRDMLVTVLHRLEDTPVSNEVMYFPDVNGDAWYAEALQWATANKIISGYGNGTFGPNGNVTREQIAVILYRYANAIGMRTDERGYTNQFKDGDDISAWAHDAMSWAIEAGLFNGDNQGNLKPTDSVTRAEVVALIKRFVEHMVK
ncbi:MAG: leucine-rich repeat protein [Clostridia bacterium]|nr:leucine-rich repeat protein [Clostridia bacterium]